MKSPIFWFLLVATIALIIIPDPIPVIDELFMIYLTIQAGKED